MGTRYNKHDRIIVPLLFDTLSATLATGLRETQTSPIRWFKMLQAGATFSF